MEIKSLKIYIEANINKTKDDVYYNESFCNLTLDYYGSMGEFTKEDIEYLNENGYTKSDFVKMVTQ